MCIKHDVMNAYHLAIGRHEDKTGESFPLVRYLCVDEDKRVVWSTNVFDPVILACWSIGGSGAIRIRLVGATR